MSNQISDLFQLLEERGFIHQCTDSDGLRAALAAGPLTAYLGFDATADSLHVGHLQGLMLMRWLQLGALFFNSSVVLVDSLVLRNPPELKARKRFTTLPVGAQKTLRGPIKNGISDAASAAPHLLSQYYTGRFKHLSSKSIFN